ncbi:hypothetical protein RI367_002089 [Sorochytrium milnesiophthora]
MSSAIAAVVVIVVLAGIGAAVYRVWSRRRLAKQGRGEAQSVLRASSAAVAAGGRGRSSEMARATTADHRNAALHTSPISPGMDPATLSASSDATPRAGGGASMLQIPSAHRPRHQQSTSSVTSVLRPASLVVSRTQTVKAGTRRKTWLAYVPILDDELSLQVGEMVTIEEYYESFWARGINERGERGNFPLYCVEPEVYV